MCSKTFTSTVPGASVPEFVRCARERRSKTRNANREWKQDSTEAPAKGSIFEPASLPALGSRPEVRKALPRQRRTVPCRLGSRPNGVVCGSDLSPSETHRLESTEGAHAAILGLEATGNRSQD